MNKPYVKVIENGIVQNPITKHNPYLHHSENRRSRRNKGVELKPGKCYLIGDKQTGFMYYKIRPQFELDENKRVKVILHFDEKPKYTRKGRKR
jgi:hypothetical protein